MLILVPQRKHKVKLLDKFKHFSVLLILAVTASTIASAQNTVDTNNLKPNSRPLKTETLTLSKALDMSASECGHMEFIDAKNKVVYANLFDSCFTDEAIKKQESLWIDCGYGHPGCKLNPKFINQAFVVTYRVYYACKPDDPVTGAIGGPVLGLNITKMVLVR